MERLPGNLQIHGFGRKLDVSTIVYHQYLSLPFVTPVGVLYGFVWFCSIVGISDVEAGSLSVGLPSISLSLSLCICIYIYTYVYIRTYIYIYTYILYSISNLFNSIYINTLYIKFTISIALSLYIIYM